MEISKAIEQIGKIKTPLTLGGLVFVVLYLIYQQVLSLNIFSELTDAGTLLIIDKILDRLFWLALISLLLGVVSYLLIRFMGPIKKESNVELLEANNDDSRSEYAQITEDGIKKIKK